MRLLLYEVSYSCCSSSSCILFCTFLLPLENLITTTRWCISTEVHISCFSWKVNLELYHVAGDPRCSYTLLLAWARKGRVQCCLLLLHTHNPILREFNICLIADRLDEFLHPEEKKPKTNKKMPKKINKILPTKPPTKWQTKTPKLSIYQVEEMHWDNWEVKVAKQQDAALEECELLFPVAGSHLISSVKMQLYFQVKRIWKQKY